jgi:hypothetical protein
MTVGVITMPKLKDMTALRFGRLTVTGRVDSDSARVSALRQGICPGESLGGLLFGTMQQRGLQEELSPHAANDRHPRRRALKLEGACP